MNHITSIALAACCLLLAGCSNTGTPTKGVPSTPASAKIAKTGKAKPCELSMTELRTCTKRGASDNWVCDVFVYNVKPMPVVLPYTLITPKPEEAKNLKIVWHLIDPYDEFEFHQGDGPQELKNNKEFEDFGSVNRVDDAASSAKGSKYRMNYKNTDVGTEHWYTIQFRNKKGQVFSCDPNIVNSGN